MNGKKALFNAQVANHLKDGPKPVEQLAKDVGAVPKYLDRLLRYCVSFGVFSQPQIGFYENNPPSEWLICCKMFLSLNFLCHCFCSLAGSERIILLLLSSLCLSI
jgi:hypothetical protein